MNNPEQSCITLLQDFFLQSSQSLTDSYSACSSSLTKKNIHNLRLALKNLKAFCNLFDSIQSRRPSKKSFSERLEQLFILLGTLRDVQVSRRILDDFSIGLGLSYKKLRKGMSKTIKSRSEEVTQMIPELNPSSEIVQIENKLQRFTTRNTDETKNRKLICKYLLTSLNNIQVMLKLRQSERVLHTIRANVKSLFYMYQIFSREKWILELVPVEEELLNHFQLELGEWHDLVVLKHLVRELRPRDHVKNRKLLKYKILDDSIRKKHQSMIRSIKKTIVPHFSLLQIPKTY